MSSAFRSMTRRSGSIGRYRTAESCQVMDGNPELHGDRAYTIRITFISLAIGLAIAAVVGVILIIFSQPVAPKKKKPKMAICGIMVSPVVFFNNWVLARGFCVFPSSLVRPPG